ncbi:hypothetical protein BC829DRAFT_397667, partial [Chytridium lagenaria]
MRQLLRWLHALLADRGKRTTALLGAVAALTNITFLILFIVLAYPSVRPTLFWKVQPCSLNALNYESRISCMPSCPPSSNATSCMKQSALPAFFPSCNAAITLLNERTQTLDPDRCFFSSCPYPEPKSCFEGSCELSSPRGQGVQVCNISCEPQFTNTVIVQLNNADGSSSSAYRLNMTTSSRMRAKDIEQRLQSSFRLAASCYFDPTNILPTLTPDIIFKIQISETVLASLAAMAFFSIVSVYFLLANVLKTSFSSIVERKLKGEFGHLHIASPAEREQGTAQSQLRTELSLSEARKLASQLSFGIIFGIAAPFAILLPTILFGKLGYEGKRTLSLLWSVSSVFGLAVLFVRCFRIARGLAHRDMLYDIIFVKNTVHSVPETDYLVYILLVALPLFSFGFESFLPFGKDSGILYYFWLYSTRVFCPCMGFLWAIFALLPFALRRKKAESRVSPSAVIHIPNPLHKMNF